MKIIKKPVYQTSDGTEFLDEEEAQRHEDKLAALSPEKTVAGKSVNDLADAVSGLNKPLADAIEALASMVVKGRYARGEFKRPPRSARGYTAAMAQADEVVEDGVVIKSRDGEVGVPDEPLHPRPLAGDEGEAF